MNEEHTPNPLYSSSEYEPTPESIADRSAIEPDETGNPTHLAEFTDVSVELNLDAITHESLNWQEIEESVNEGIAPEVLEALQQEMEQVLHKNVALLDRISQLESALAHSQQALQTYQERQPATEALLSQRLEEINTLQEENKRLLRELEQSSQKGQRQQILVQTLTEQLDSSQTQVAQLERDCAIAQQRCHEQATQLSQRDKFCLDLQTRLHRQQRYTLQFKNALDRCLELSPSNREQILNESSGSLGNLKLAKIEQGLTPKAIAIQPWSAHQWQDSLLETPLPNPIPEENEGRDLETPDPELMAQSSVNRPHLKLFKSDELSSPNPEIGASPTPVIQDSEEAQVQAILEPLEELEELEPEPPSFSAEFDEIEEDFIESAEETVASEFTADDEQPAEELSSEEVSRPEQPEVPLNIPQGNWPSPLVYPLRQPKKRKSFAAIDLPSFPRP
ncbi:hypothetical protein PMG71_11765 [Roseofilum sp. BLCC_M154]|uniref:Uncharacterized protein n=1 Tax=Roseofilum acuticapitatum BLCC-M154 TaxID=3022444 RepID=A0ABT7AUX8_9CYAN|nr:hypothetical protein [Roseofilum acuticapitatum]MDJ1170106.1 hypothetical protein [Roseofilum acuticapitatum BLCC-M154]